MVAVRSARAFLPLPVLRERVVRSDSSDGDQSAADMLHTTPLLRAVQESRTGLVRTLLKHGADPNAPDAVGLTPLKAACDIGSDEIADILLDAGGRAYCGVCRVPWPPRNPVEGSSCWPGYQG
jgi:hypothetical protein